MVKERLKMSSIIFDNRRPDDNTYPNFTPAEFLGNKFIFVDDEDIIVNSNGDVMVVTTGNVRWKDKDSFLRDLNIGYIRAKYLNNTDDSLEHTNQIRLATEEEISAAKSWTNSKFSYKVDSKGQLLLV